MILLVKTFGKMCPQDLGQKTDSINFIFHSLILLVIQGSFRIVGDTTNNSATILKFTSTVFL